MECERTSERSDHPGKKTCLKKSETRKNKLVASNKYIMGLCGSSGGGSVPMDSDQKRDIDSANPVCRVLGINPKQCRKLLECYEECMKKGKGNAHRYVCNS